VKKIFGKKIKIFISFFSSKKSYDTTNGYDHCLEQNSSTDSRFHTTTTNTKIEGVRKRITVRSSPQPSPLNSPQQQVQVTKTDDLLSLSTMGYSTLLGNSTDLTPDALLHSNRNMDAVHTATISTPNNNNNNNQEQQKQQQDKLIQQQQQQQQLIIYEDTKFQPTIDFVRLFLDNVVQQSSPFGDKEQNKLTYEVILKLILFLLNQIHTK